MSTETVTKKLFTIDEFQLIEDAGIFPPDSRFELIRGEIILPMSRPRPDVAILKPLPELFGPFEPTPDDFLLLIEIADTTIRYERKTKTPLYAEAEIPECWILNIGENVLEVWTDPVDGQYRNAT